ncbi:LytTR family DNA-binding domain-containing protein [Polaribacter sp.]|uniref:LytTR family DNA-binding domain-containing protein n=1 Tax=Polaribacter sp. TaxID=1920175 RepID=UPI0025CE1845|nr:LytTR family DNA-binding domain-containing protein [Polaribacter sp.]
MTLLVSLLFATVIFISISITTQNKTITATIENISSDEDKVDLGLYTNDNFMKEPIMAKNAKIENWQEQLDPEHFFRVNRTYIVHIDAIKDIIAYSNSRLKLMLHSYNEQEIIVNRERVKDFKNWID